MEKLQVGEVFFLENTVSYWRFDLTNLSMVDNWALAIYVGKHKTDLERAGTVTHSTNNKQLTWNWNIEGCNNNFLRNFNDPDLEIRAMVDRHYSEGNDGLDVAEHPVTIGDLIKSEMDNAPAEPEEFDKSNDGLMPEPDRKVAAWELEEDFKEAPGFLIITEAKGDLIEFRVDRKPMQEKNAKRIEILRGVADYQGEIQQVIYADDEFLADNRVTGTLYFKMMGFLPEYVAAQTKEVLKLKHAEACVDYDKLLYVCKSLYSGGVIATPATRAAFGDMVMTTGFHAHSEVLAKLTEIINTLANSSKYPERPNMFDNLLPKEKEVE